MKTNSTFKTKATLALLLLSTVLRAQTIVTGVDIDANNVKARINNHNANFWDPTSQTNYYEIPQGSGKSTIYTGGLWIGGYDAQGNLHAAAQTYRKKQHHYGW